jgi:hypothetical protein
MCGSIASVVGSFSAIHQSFGSKPRRPPELWRWCVRRRFQDASGSLGASAVRQPRHTVQHWLAVGTAPCPGFRSSIAHNVRNDVDNELLAIAVPTSRDENRRLNSDARGLCASDPRAQDAGTVLQRPIDSQHGRHNASTHQDTSGRRPFGGDNSPATGITAPSPLIWRRKRQKCVCRAPTAGVFPR